MRYCPNCDKDVYTKWSAFQIILFIVLILASRVLAILYLIFKSRKCEECGCRTRGLRPKG